MSIADHFFHAPDAGFVRTYDAQSARRQFQVSVALILILAAAAFALGVLVHFDNLSSGIHPARQKVHDVHFAELTSGARS